MVVTVDFFLGQVREQDGNRSEQLRASRLPMTQHIVSARSQAKSSVGE
jgi:hypothetical protein